MLLLLLLFRTRDNLLATRDTRRLDYLDRQKKEKKKKNILDRPKNSRPVNKFSTGKEILDR